MTDKRFLPFRPRPQKDELFSSWLVRLAWENVEKIHPFSVRLFKGQKQHWYRDLDLSISEQDIAHASFATGISCPILFETTLQSYIGKIHELGTLHGPSAWIIPIVKIGRSRRGRGQQYCARCFEEDVIPYYRKQWRLAFSVVCVNHGCFLRDGCPCCDSPVSFHESDFGRRTVDTKYSWIFCRHCGVSLCEGGNCHSPISASMLSFQKKLIDMTSAGHHEDFPGALNYSHLFLDGLHHIIRILCSEGNSSRLRSYLLKREGQLDLNFSRRHTRLIFERLRVGDRFTLLDLARSLLVDWPNNFIQICQVGRVSSSYIDSAHKSLPYWLEKEVRWNLNDQYYAPNDEEKASVRLYLERQGKEPSQNAIRRLLGSAHSSRLLNDPMRRPKNKWNPREHLARIPKKI
jgi:hypothetical protein